MEQWLKLKMNKLDISIEERLSNLEQCNELNLKTQQVVAEDLNQKRQEIDMLTKAFIEQKAMIQVLFEEISILRKNQK